MDFKLIILSSGTGSPIKDKLNQSSQWLSVGKEKLLIDCGEATQFQLVKYGISYMKISTILISHLHADHYIGLIGLINTYNLNHRTTPLTIYGPSKLEEIITSQLKSTDVILRYTLTFKTIDFTKKSTLLNNSEIKITTFPLNHRIETVGFLIKQKKQPWKIIKELAGIIPVEAFYNLKSGKDYHHPNGKTYLWKELTTSPPPPRSYAYITDTLYLPGLSKEIKDVTLLYHESTFQNDMADYAIETKHSTNLQAAQMAKAAKATTLILGHISTRYKPEEITNLLTQAKQIFPNTFIATEGSRFEL